MTTHVRPDRASTARVQEAILPAETVRTIRSLARSLGVNRPAVFLGLWTLLLHRYCGDEDILVGMPVLGRPDQRSTTRSATS